MKGSQVKPGNAGKDFLERKKDAARLAKEVAKRKKEREKREIQVEKREAGFEKSRITMERLQLAWIKANLTFTALGFTAYKFYYARIEDGLDPRKYFITGKELGIFLIIVGFSMLLIATLQHKRKVTELKMRYEKMQYSTTLLLSWLMLSFSVIVMLMVMFRM